MLAAAAIITAGPAWGASGATQARSRGSASSGAAAGSAARTGTATDAKQSSTANRTGAAKVKPRPTSGGAGLGNRQSSTANHECCWHMGDRTLREGMRGHDVRVLQDFLSRAGYQNPVTGYFGPTTRSNVQSFQRAHGFAANGIVTYAVQARLRAVVAKIDSAPGPKGRTRLNPDGTATAPSNAPGVVRAVVAAANSIINTSYCYAGGHSTWRDSCYDCSGSVSFALHGGRLLDYPEDSTELESYGSPGPGRWITIYANANHTWIVVAGRAFDTADFGGPNIPSGDGPRWRSNPTGNFGDGESYVVRHPTGL